MTTKNLPTVGDSLKRLYDDDILSWELKKLISENTEATRIINPRLVNFVREALFEAEERKLGEYMTAAMIIGVLNGPLK